MIVWMWPGISADAVGYLENIEGEMACGPSCGDPFVGKETVEQGEALFRLL